jgi:hypothetical protein
LTGTRRQRRNGVEISITRTPSVPARRASFRAP